MKPFFYSILTRGFVIYTDQNKKNAIGSDLEVISVEKGSILNFVSKKVHDGSDQMYALYIKDRGFLEAPKDEDWLKIAQISNPEEKVMKTNEIRFDYEDLQTLAFDIKEVDPEKGKYQIRTREGRCFNIKEGRLGIGECKRDKSMFYIVKQSPDEPKGVVSTVVNKASTVNTAKEHKIIVISTGSDSIPTAYSLQFNDQDEVVNFKKMEGEPSQYQEDSSGHNPLSVKLKRNKSSKNLQKILDAIKKESSSSEENEIENIRRNKGYQRTTHHRPESYLPQPSAPPTQMSPSMQMGPSMQMSSPPTQMGPSSIMQMGPPPPIMQMPQMSPPPNPYSVPSQQLLSSEIQQPGMLQQSPPQSPVMSFLSMFNQPTMPPQQLPPPFEQGPYNNPMMENPILDGILNNVYRRLTKT